MRRFLIALIALTPLIAHAAHVPEHTAGKEIQCLRGLQWNTNQEPDMDHYNFFTGTSSGIYQAPFVVPHDPSVPETIVRCEEVGMAVDGQYFVTLEAEDKGGLKSPKAPEKPFFVDRPPATPGGLDAN